MKIQEPRLPELPRRRSRHSQEDALHRSGDHGQACHLRDRGRRLRQPRPRRSLYYAGYRPAGRPITALEGKQDL